MATDVQRPTAPLVAPLSCLLCHPLFSAGCPGTARSARSGSATTICHSFHLYCSLRYVRLILLCNSLRISRGDLEEPTSFSSFNFDRFRCYSRKIRESCNASLKIGHPRLFALVRFLLFFPLAAPEPLTLSNRVMQLMTPSDSLGFSHHGILIRI